MATTSDDVSARNLVELTTSEVVGAEARGSRWHDTSKQWGNGGYL